jgi:adenylate cyclase
MHDALDEWNRARVAAGDPPLAMGIGVDYGVAVIGDVDRERGLLSFTVIGDTVNVAVSSGQIVVQHGTLFL